MTITETERQRLETALDRMWDLISEQCNEQQMCTASLSYAQAVAIVREKPEGQRRVRSDFNQRRPTPNGELPV